MNHQTIAELNEARTSSISTAAAIAIDGWGTPLLWTTVHPLTPKGGGAVRSRLQLFPGQRTNSETDPGANHEAN